jgi:hypothetical protein
MNTHTFHKENRLTYFAEAETFKPKETTSVPQPAPVATEKPEPLQSKKKPAGPEEPEKDEVLTSLEQKMETAQNPEKLAKQVQHINAQMEELQANADPEVANSPVFRLLLGSRCEQRGQKIVIVMDCSMLFSPSRAGDPAFASSLERLYRSMGLPVTVEPPLKLVVQMESIEEAQRGVDRIRRAVNTGPIVHTAEQEREYDQSHGVTGVTSFDLENTETEDKTETDTTATANTDVVKTTDASLNTMHRAGDLNQRLSLHMEHIPAGVKKTALLRAYVESYFARTRSGETLFVVPRKFAAEFREEMYMFTRSKELFTEIRKDAQGNYAVVCTASGAKSILSTLSVFSKQKEEIDWESPNMKKLKENDPELYEELRGNKEQQKTLTEAEAAATRAQTPEI